MMLIRGYKVMYVDTVEMDMESKLKNIKQDMRIGNEKKFYCQPGVVGKKMAVQVIGKIDQSESDEFEELSVEGDESYE